MSIRLNDTIIAGNLGTVREVIEGSDYPVTSGGVNTALKKKQDKLIAGDNVTISDDNVISVEVPYTQTLVKGDGIDISKQNVWEQLTAPTISSASAMIYDGNKFIIFDGSNLGMAWCINPDTNEVSSLDTLPRKTFTSVAHSGNNYVATAGSNFYHSEDGEIWTQIEPPEAMEWTSVTFCNNRFIANSDSAVSAISTDGVTWSSSTLSTVASYTTYGNGKYVSIYSGEASTTASYSEDGVNWTQTSLPKEANWKKVIWSSSLNKFIAIASNGNEYATSTDGASWTTVTNYFYSSTGNLEDIACGNDMVVMVGHGDYSLVLNDDGTSKLIKLPKASDGSSKYSLIAYGEDLFFAFGNCRICKWDNTSKEVISAIGSDSSNTSGMPIGTVFPMLSSGSYTPTGALPCDGKEYSRSLFSAFYSNYLVKGVFNTCTYSEYASDIATYGSCIKFALDTDNEKFKVPTIKDGAYITQAKSDSELGKAYNESLPNITGTIGDNLNGSASNTGAFKNVKVLSKAGLSSGSSYSLSPATTFNASLSSSTYQDGAKVQGDNVRLRYFVQVANGNVTDADINWAELMTLFRNKADNDLSNLSDTGKKVIDGQWVGKTLLLAENISVPVGQNIKYTYDLSSYLPNDNCNYEVMVSCDITTGETSGSLVIASAIGKDVNNNDIWARLTACRTRTTSSVMSIGGNTIPISTSRTLQMSVTVEKSAGTLLLYVEGYRRLGTNN